MKKQTDMVGDAIKLIMMLFVFGVCIALKHGEQIMTSVERWMQK